MSVKKVLDKAIRTLDQSDADIADDLFMPCSRPASTICPREMLSSFLSGRSTTV